jgi:hypothetical protein
MLKVGDVLDLGQLGMKFYIKKTAAETNGQLPTAMTSVKLFAGWNHRKYG